MEINRLGKYSFTDSQGYLLNSSNLQGNNDHWLAVIEALKDIYLLTLHILRH